MQVKDVNYGKTVRKSYAKYQEILQMPNLLKIQKDSYDWFLREVCTSIATLPLRQDVVQRLKQEADAANDNLKEDETPRRWWSDPTRLVTNGPYTASAEDENALTLTENTSYGKKLTGPEDLTFRFGDTQTAEVLYDLSLIHI